jgi:hypothetical protein
MSLGTDNVEGWWKDLDQNIETTGTREPSLG